MHTVDMAPHKVDQRYQIEFMLKEGISQTEMKRRLDAMHGNNAFSKSSIQRWCSQFQNGHIQKTNLLKSSAPKKRTAAKINQARDILRVHHRSTLRQLSRDINLSYGCT